jgi:hypothetical protein
MVRVAIMGASIASVLVVGQSSFLASLAIGLLGCLVLFAFLGLVLDNEGRQLETRINIGALATSLAIKGDDFILDVDLGFGILALLAQNKLGNESIKIVLQFIGLVGSVDDPAIISRVGVGLSAKFKSEVLDDICYALATHPLGNGNPQVNLTGRGPSQGRSYTGQIGNNGFDAVAFAFDLGHEAFHLVAVEGIGDILLTSQKGSWRPCCAQDTYPTNVESGHDGQLIWKRTNLADAGYDSGRRESGGERELESLTERRHAVGRWSTCLV